VLDGRDAAVFDVSDPLVNSPGQGVQGANGGPEWSHTIEIVSLPKPARTGVFPQPLEAVPFPNPEVASTGGAQP
jgi:hypothetical protein